MCRMVFNEKKNKYDMPVLDIKEKRQMGLTRIN